MKIELPNAPQAEAELLGTILQNETAIHNCIHLVNEDCFYYPKHKNMWNVMQELHKNGLQIDFVSVGQMLTDRKQIEQFGGFIGLTEFASSYFQSNVTGLAKVLREKSIRRAIIVENQKLIQLAFDPMTDIEAELSKTQNKLSESLSKNLQAETTAHSICKEIAREISDNLGKFQEVVGVPTGFESFDKRLSGISLEGDLTILAARPSMGKTTVALNMAQNAQKYFGYSGAFFSLEMSKKQIGRSLLAQRTGISTDDIKRNKLNEFQVDLMFNELENTPKAKLFIEDENSQLEYIVAKIHKLKRDYDISFVFIDYMQLITCAPKQNREKEIEHISRTLKILAGKLKIAIIALCQLSRAVETRGGDKKPMLSDLRDSGSIEQDATVVSFLWRPEYYGIVEDENGNSLEGVTAIITKKNRFGPLGEDYLYFDKQTSTFSDYDHTTGNKVTIDMYNHDLVRMQDMNQGKILDFRQRIGQEENPPF